MAETTIQNNSLAAFLGSIKFKSSTAKREESYPGAPLANFKSMLKSSKDISQENAEFILSDN